MAYRYRSPMRPLDLGYLDGDIRAGFDIDAWLAQDILTRENLKKAVYTFDQPIPVHFVRQWDLEVLND